MVTTPFLFLMLAAAPQQGTAHDHQAPGCATAAAALPAELQGWSSKTPVRAGATAMRATKLAIGQAAIATLLPTPRVAYTVRPEKPGGPVSSGGLFAFTVSAGGRYRVALGAAAWVDVLAGTMPAVSVAHGHGPECTGVRKMVDFDLKPGRYLLQVAGSGSATLPLMVARVP